MAGAALASCLVLPPRVEAAEKTVVMITWLGCEDVCKGLKDSLEEKKIDVSFVVDDAAQDKSKLPDFVKDARDRKADVVVTWGTKTTLGMVGTLKDQQNSDLLNDIPVVFTVVADPIGAGIIESYEKTGRANVTGTRNRVPESVNIKSIKRYLPSFDHLGLLFDRSEPNSVKKTEELTALSEKMKFKFDALPLPALADGTPDPAKLPQAVAQLKAAGVQFVYLGSSTFLEKNADVFTDAAVANGLPVLSPYEHLVSESRALMSVAARDYDVGKLAGEQVAKILAEGAKPGDMPVVAMEKFAYLVNMKVAKQLNLFPPVEFLQFVEKVE
ncbi:ABC transporter substrate-binding protein [Mesorhizobium australicum]|uniref:ABC transporter substrate-binding protein n=1 Tax=Mesorhizobium australicum TaxID=536018 RepID=UPI0018DC8161|nr:ABC transporter substrate-binding protein [Mesorhizobium sp. LNHC220B00]